MLSHIATYALAHRYHIATCGLASLSIQLVSNSQFLCLSWLYVFRLSWLHLSINESWLYLSANGSWLHVYVYVYAQTKVDRQMEVPGCWQGQRREGDRATAALYPACRVFCPVHMYMRVKFVGVSGACGKCEWGMWQVYGAAHRGRWHLL